MLQNRAILPALCLLAMAATIATEESVRAERRTESDGRHVVLQRAGRLHTTHQRPKIAPPEYRQENNTATNNTAGTSLINGDFEAGLTGWEWTEFSGTSSPGQVFADNGEAVIEEGDSFLVTLSQTFVIPVGSDSISFDIVATSFDLSAAFIPDAFEASLLNEFNEPIATPWDSFATSFFNMQEDGATNLGDNTSYNGVTVTANITGAVDGTVATLYFDFVAPDTDTAGWVRIDNVTLGIQCNSQGEEDCNNNGILDSCDIDDGTSQDCNNNGLPDECDIELGATDCNENGALDECDIADGTSFDCNNDNLPDECAACPSLDLIFVMDTSGSMQDEGDALCDSISDVVSELATRGIEVDFEILGIAPQQVFDLPPCVTDIDQSVLAILGDDIPGDNGACADTLTGGGNSEQDENWASATAIVADRYPWTADAVRLIVPISDEGPCLGNPCSDPGSDRDAIENAIDVAAENNVVVSPIAAAGSSACVIGLGEDLATGTGGTHFQSTDPGLDLANAISDLVEDACNLFSDCDNSGIPDQCELFHGCDCDDVIDLAEFAAFQPCLTGPDAIANDEDCDCFDIDRDGHIDLKDIANFQLAFNQQ